MIINYSEFLNESKKIYTKKDPEFWGITKYEWIQDRLNCYENVNISDNKYTNGKLPFMFGEIHGDFECINSGIIDFNPESPKLVTGNYYMDDNKIDIKNIENYPLCITKGDIFCSGNNRTNTGVHYFYVIANLVRENMEIFIPLVNNKTLFHQMIMRLNPELIPEYTTITPPSKKSILLSNI